LEGCKSREREYPRVDIVLIRHGDHEDKDPSAPTDEHTPLTQEGKDKVDRLKNLLACLNLNPEIYLTSKHKHARETAKRLSDGRSNPVPIDDLTPGKTGVKSFETIISVAEKKVAEQSQQTTVVIVGHEPELDDIFKSLESHTWLNPGASSKLFLSLQVAKDPDEMHMLKYYFCRVYRLKKVYR
jgi:phosphohistidine phosphatase SixA